MERIVNLHIEKLRDSFFLATCENIQGLVAKGELLLRPLLHIHKHSHAWL